MATTKTKVCVSIDEDIARLVAKLTADRKGGFSGWVNAACKKEMKREARRKMAPGYLKP